MWGGQGWLSLSSTVVPDNEPDNDADVVMIIKCGSQLTHGVQSSLVDLSGKFFFSSRLFIYFDIYGSLSKRKRQTCHSKTRHIKHSPLLVHLVSPVVKRTQAVAMGTCR